VVENRRKIIVTLTRKGQNLIKKAEPALDIALTEIIERLGEAETKQLIASVERFVAILQESVTE
jgi:DNA-binding MarR family transcriptional regulator